MTWRTSALALILLSLTACGQPTTNVPEIGTIEGEVLYRERILLPPGAQLTVQLEDISQSDAPAVVVVSATQALNGTAPPYPFALEIDSSALQAASQYALRARIELDGQVRFTNTDYIDPFADGPLTVMLQGVQQRAPHQAQEQAPPVAALEGVEWVLVSLEGFETLAGLEGRSPDISFDANEQRASGFSGCNRFTGGYEREGSSEQGAALRFLPMAGTLMACPEGAELERAFLQMLSSVDAFRLAGEELVLLNGYQPVARFRAL